MSGPARNLIHKSYQRALGRWPKDPLRAEVQFQDILSKRLEKAFAPAAVVTEQKELKQLNALHTLLDDRYRTKYRINGSLLEPKSNPMYYKDLMTELEEAPKRSFLGRLGKRLGGLIRLAR